MDGNIEKYKARLIAKWFAQIFGIDYQQTFVPVAKLNSIGVLLSLSVNSNWPLHKPDVKNAFLSRDLENEVYKSPLPGFEEGEDKFCKQVSSRTVLNNLQERVSNALGKLQKAMVISKVKQIIQCSTNIRKKGK